VKQFLLLAADIAGCEVRRRNYLQGAKWLKNGAACVPAMYVADVDDSSSFI
jgi:hypothetical protein